MSCYPWHTVMKFEDFVTCPVLSSVMWGLLYTMWTGLSLESYYKSYSLLCVQCNTTHGIPFIVDFLKCSWHPGQGWEVLGILPPHFFQHCKSIHHNTLTTHHTRIIPVRRRCMTIQRAQYTAKVTLTVLRLSQLQLNVTWLSLSHWVSISPIPLRLIACVQCVGCLQSVTRV